MRGNLARFCSRRTETAVGLRSCVSDTIANQIAQGVRVHFHPLSLDDVVEEPTAFQYFDSVPLGA